MADGRRRASRLAARAAAGAALLVAVAACGGGGEPGEGADSTGATPGAAAEPALISSLDVGVSNDTVRFSLHVSSASSEPVVLDFATGQRFDFEVRDAAGAVVWRWSEDQLFTQALASDTLRPGAVRTYEAAWVPSVDAGRYVATARLLARQHPIELVTDTIELRDP